MGLFRKNEKTKEEPEKFDKDFQWLVDNNPNSFWKPNYGNYPIQWIRILRKRPKGFKTYLDRTTLEKILNKLEKTSSYDVWCGERNSPNHYRVPEVQALVDYANTARDAIDWMKEKAIEGGIAHYNAKGEFKYNDQGGEDE